MSLLLLLIHKLLPKESEAYEMLDEMFALVVLFIFIPLDFCFVASILQKMNLI